MSYQIFYHLKKGVNQMAVDVYINFKGNCRDAVEYYAQVFGTDKPKIMTIGEAPSDPNYPIPEEAKNLIAHSRLDIRGSTFMFSDVFPGMPFVEGNNISFSISTKNKDEITSLFNKLSDGGKVGMELQETFWSKYYGNTKDKFGIEWQFNLDSGEVW
jgi:PhnB protein